jgi:hypothetical protein
MTQTRATVRRTDSFSLSRAPLGRPRTRQQHGVPICKATCRRTYRSDTAGQPGPLRFLREAKRLVAERIAQTRPVSRGHFAFCVNCEAETRRFGLAPTRHVSTIRGLSPVCAPRRRVPVVTAAAPISQPWRVTRARWSRVARLRMGIVVWCVHVLFAGCQLFLHPEGLPA